METTTDLITIDYEARPLTLACQCGWESGAYDAKHAEKKARLHARIACRLAA